MSNSQGTSGEDWADARGALWLAELDSYEQMLEPLGIALLDRAALQNGQHIADIGCGGGRTSRLAAHLVAPGGSVHGIDIAPMLMDEATRRADATGIGNIRFSTGDAASFVPEGAPFDRLISRLGVMFFADPEAAFTHLRTLLVDGGRADFVVWASPQDNVWMSGARAIVAEHIELPTADPMAPGPFRLADPDATGSLLHKAGFSQSRLAARAATLPRLPNSRSAPFRSPMCWRVLSPVLKKRSAPRSPRSSSSSKRRRAWLFRPRHGWCGQQHDRPGAYGCVRHCGSSRARLRASAYCVRRGDVHRHPHCQ